MSFSKFSLAFFVSVSFFVVRIFHSIFEVYRVQELLRPWIRAIGRGVSSLSIALMAQAGLRSSARCCRGARIGSAFPLRMSHCGWHPAEAFKARFSAPYHRAMPLDRSESFTSLLWPGCTLRRCWQQYMLRGLLPVCGCVPPQPRPRVYLSLSSRADASRRVSCIAQAALHQSTWPRELAWPRDLSVKRGRAGGDILIFRERT